MYVQHTQVDVHTDLLLLFFQSIQMCNGIVWFIRHIDHDTVRVLVVNRHFTSRADRYTTRHDSTSPIDNQFLLYYNDHVNQIIKMKLNFLSDHC